MLQVDPQFVPHQAADRFCRETITTDRSEGYTICYLLQRAGIPIILSDQNTRSLQ
jgi:hypothetical protein